MLPDHKPWLWFEELSKAYGAPLVTVWIGRNPTVWVNDAWAASELFDKRAGVYSSRPRMVVFAELGAGQSNLVNMYTWTPEQRERWRVQRKLMHHAVYVNDPTRHEACSRSRAGVVRSVVRCVMFPDETDGLISTLSTEGFNRCESTAASRTTKAVSWRTRC